VQPEAVPLGQQRLEPGTEGERGTAVSGRPSGQRKPGGWHLRRRVVAAAAPLFRMPGDRDRRRSQNQGDDHDDNDHTVDIYVSSHWGTRQLQQASVALKLKEPCNATVSLYRLSYPFARTKPPAPSTAEILGFRLQT
jgi:hypothetical protein